MVGLTGHYHPEFQAANKNLPRIGKIIKMDERIHMGVQDFPVNTYLPRGGRGVVLENGIHTFARFVHFSQSDGDLDSINIEYILFI